jgi:hypothetical protein
MQYRLEKIDKLWEVEKGGISGSHGCKHEDGSFLGYGAV